MHKIPNLKSFRNAKDFFAEFYQINQPHLSHRSFSAEIDWPVSLLGDMIQGRKKLTVNRALEFSKFANLNSVQSEYLLMLCLKEVNNEGVQSYANTYLDTEGVVIDQDPSAPLESHHLISAETYSKTDFMVLHAFLTWSKGQVDFEQISQRLPAFPKFRDPEFVTGLISKMNEDEIIEGSMPLVKILKKNLLAPVSTVRSRNAYLDLFKQISELTPDKVAWRAGTVIFPNSKINELKDKMNALTSWILMTSQQGEPTEASPLNEHTILQIVLSAFELLDLQDSK